MNSFIWDVREKLYRIFRHRFPFHFIIQQEGDNIERMLNSIESDGKKYVDLGTGSGNALKFFKHTPVSLGVDFTFSMLRRARQLHPDVFMIQADAISLPLQNGSVEISSAIGLIEYIKDIDLFLDEVHRIMINSGIFLFTFSPPGIITNIRSMFGNRVYPRTVEQILEVIRRIGFQVMNIEHSFMQWQILTKKI